MDRKAAAIMCWCLVLSALSLFVSAKAMAEVYKYTDEKGATHYVSDISQVPERYRDSIRTSEGGISAETKFGLSEDEGEGALMDPEGVFSVILVSLIKSGLVFSGGGIFLLLFLLVLGMLLTRAVLDKKDRRKYRAGLVVTAGGAVVLLWLSLAGPHSLSCAGMIEDYSVKAASRKPNVEDREKLNSLARFSSSMEAVLEKVNFDRV